MNEPVLKSERLSALVDDETDAFETRRLLDELLRTEEDRRTWSRYHLIGDCMRGKMRQTAPVDFLNRVQEGLADEPAWVEEPRRVPAANWRKSLAGVGIAATVAAVSLLVFQALAPTPGGFEQPLAGDLPEPATVVVEVVPPSDPDPRFARYLENHAELLAPGSSAFARVRNSVDGD